MTPNYPETAISKEMYNLSAKVIELVELQQQIDNKQGELVSLHKQRDRLMETIPPALITNLRNNAITSLQEGNIP